jgi:hypothetical protein
VKTKYLTALFAGLLFAGAAHANLLTNPGFDADDASSGDSFGASGWACDANCFTTNNSSGANSPAADSPNNVMKVFSEGVLSQEFEAAAGDTWVATGLAQNFSGDPIENVSRLLLQILFLDAEGNFAGTAAGGNFAPGFNAFDSNEVNASSDQNTWIGLGVGTAPAPDNTATAKLVVLGLLGSGGAGFFDSITLERTVVPVPAAVWLFGSALGLLGWMRRKVS